MRDTNLVNALREHADWWENGDMMDPLGGLEKDLLAAADRIANQNTHIAALQREIEKLRGQLPRWIPVTERLPEDRSDVLVVAYWHERWGVYMGWCAPERVAWSVHIGIGDRSDIAVTHWMPLPEPPKEER
jgi:hypothetical protein